MNIGKFLKKGFLIGCLVLLLSIVFSLLVGEYIVKHIFPQSTYKLASLEGLHAMATGENIPFTLQKNLKNSVHMGYTHEFNHMVNTNSFGTRGAEFSLTKDQNTYRILFLGDSMTFGWGVEDNQTYPQIIQDNLNLYLQNNNFETINSGMASGRTLDSMLVYFKDNGLKYKPDLLVLDFFPWNDFTDLADMKWEKTDQQGYPTKIISNKEIIKNGTFRYRVKTNWMYEIPVLRNSHLGILVMNALERSSPKLVDKIKGLIGISENKPTLKPEEVLSCLYSMTSQSCSAEIFKQWEKAQFLIKGISKIALDNNIKFAVTIMAAPDQAIPLSQNPDRGKMLADVQPQKTIREFLDKENIPYLDLLADLSQANAKDLFYSRDGHLNPNGTKTVANSLTRYLVKNYFSTQVKEKFKSSF
jgi:lysophospholipase L1-like esterase